MNIQMNHNPSKRLWDLPQLCLICILSHLPLNQLLLVACVCTRFDALKRLICSRKSKLTLAPYPELICSWISRKQYSDANVISFFDIKFSPNETLFTPHPTSFVPLSTHFLIFKNLKNLSQIFPNISSLVVFRLELTVQKSYIESYVEELSSLLENLSFKLSDLTVVINNQFYNSKLVDVLLGLPHLESLKIDLGLQNGDKVYLQTLISGLSTKKLAQLSLGKMENFKKIDKSISQNPNNNQIENLGLMLKPKFMDQLTLFDSKNVDLNRKQVLRRLHFELNNLSRLRDLKMVCEHFTNITHLQVFLCLFNLRDFPLVVEFTQIVQSISTLRHLQTLQITTSTGFFLNELKFPSRLFKLSSNFPQLPSVQSLQINSLNWPLIRIPLDHNCTGTLFCRLYNGSHRCSIAQIFPNVHNFTISPNIGKRMYFEIDCFFYCFELLFLFHFACFLFIGFLLMCVCYAVFISYWALRYLTEKFVLRRVGNVNFAHYMNARFVR